MQYLIIVQQERIAVFMKTKWNIYKDTVKNVEKNVPTLGDQKQYKRVGEIPN